MQIEGVEDDIPETENPLAEGDSHHSTDSTDTDESQEEDSVHETPPEGREMGYREGVPRTRWLGIPVR